MTELRGRCEDVLFRERGGFMVALRLNTLQTSMEVADMRNERFSLTCSNI